MAENFTFITREVDLHIDKGRECHIADIYRNETQLVLTSPTFDKPEQASAWAKIWIEQHP